MVDYKKYGFTEIGFWLSLIGGLICTSFGVILIRLTLVLYLGLLIVLASILQRMTYKTLASVLTVLFSIIYLVFWLLVTSGWSMVYNIQIMGFTGSLFGVIGGALSVFFSVCSK